MRSPSRLLVSTCLALLAGLLTAAAAEAHQGSPNFLSVVRSVTPEVPGFSVVMLNRDDRLLVTNRGPRTVSLAGYQREPYLRFLPSGVVQRNARSPATYLNDDRTGTASVPAVADADAPPRWVTVAQDGTFEFHDHRIHWMGTGRPPIVKDPKRQTKVFDWRLPFRADAAPGAIVGTLYWTPMEDGGIPVAAVVGLLVLLVGGVLLVVVVRRRRAADAKDTPAPEAW